MTREQLQHPDVVPGAGGGPEAGLEVAAEDGERGGELPVAVDRGVVERRRLAFQRHQEMPGVEHLLASAVAARVRGDDLAVGHHRDALDVPLDRHGAERPAPGHAVAIAVEGHGLVLVHLAALKHAGVEGALGHRQRRGLVVREAGAD